MAYCKSCGNPLKDGERRCKVCGVAIEQLETVDHSQVEIIRHGAAKKRRLSFRNEAYDETTMTNMFRVFDRKALLMVFAMIAAFTLAFFVQTVESDGFSESNTIQTFCVAAAILVFLVGYVLHNRGVLMLGLLLLAAALCACAVVTFVFFRTGSIGDVLLCCLQGFLHLVLCAVTLSMFFEMTSGKRCLGLQCVLTVTAAVAILGHITLSLFVNINSDVDVVMTAWQILAVTAKILLLVTVLVLFSNMAHVDVHEPY